MMLSTEQRMATNRILAVFRHQFEVSRETKSYCDSSAKTEDGKFALNRVLSMFLYIWNFFTTNRQKQIPLIPSLLRRIERKWLFS